MHDEHKPFRERALDRLIAAFGDPERIPAEAGILYRWVLRRPHGLDLYITLDSPEMPEIAHLIVSDPRSGVVDPVVSLTMRTLPEVDAVVEKLRQQWQRGMESPRA